MVFHLMITAEESTSSRNERMLLIRPSNSQMRDTTKRLHKEYQPNGGGNIVLLAASALRQSLRFTHLISQQPGSIPSVLSALCGHEYIAYSVVVKIG